MRTDDLVALIRTVVKQFLKQYKAPQKATITSYDPKRYMVKALLQPQGIETGWLQLNTLGCGNGFGITVGPSIGDEVHVTFDGADLNSGTATSVLYGGQQVPVTTQSKEFKLHHKSGSFLYFLANGDIQINQATGSQIFLNHDGSIKALSESGSYFRMFPDGTIECHALGSTGTLKLMAETELLLSSPGTIVINTNQLTDFVTNGTSVPAYNPGLHVDHL